MSVVNWHLIEQLVTIPLFTGIIGYITNWTGILMLFEPKRFYGVKVPGVATLYPFLPRRVQVIPAIRPDGRIGWQGIVPSRAEKMASIAVDKSLSKVGSIAQFYEVMDPEYISEQLTRAALPEIPSVVEGIMRRENPRLWYSLPEDIKLLVYRRVAASLPTDVRKITSTIGENIDDYIDAKLMVIRYLSANPKVLKDIFYNVGRKELLFMQNFGFYFGYPMGFVLVGLLHFFPYWWLLPLGGIVIGYVVNYVGLTMIFEPLHSSKWVPWRQGLFLKRRQEIAEQYATVMADQVVTVENICDELLHGPRSDRTRATVESVLRESVDKASGWARGVVKLSVGYDTYERVPQLAGAEAIKVAEQTVSDPEFAAQQQTKVRDFVVARMSILRPEDLSELLRSAIKQDEWLLFLHGAVLGSAAGFLHLAIFGV
ncbi:hypothetical protein TPAU25S_02280 [Tsukamurella paurometabola]|uniref:DUF445 domain-containing protein n=1 Tax=Tsukamurella paurometabola (strain ATCC 8368 / DSM 20162 / CCUG 35730 / CIP 100753 / JCM 10117 / KCTC 9821 / NBRC 16120 / NCIMB 702349 / NCTC 13040) TaxID=521096 RepID=D5UTT0_TSUPD|nr:hypothetical protein [Tsukamurella paurometabola]ADG77434.1 conserved hypothetical protein [Tsukamurella paurometabola DSM 20162]SUP27030.1 Protein of uncharacterised function (DUF445) [Tsukamurella paurometabola]